MSRVRSIVASLLAVLLLSGASWGYVCGLACESPQTSLCAPVAMDHAAMDHAAIQMDCDHCPGKADRNASEPAVASACGAMACGQAVVLPARVDEGASHALANPHQIVMALAAPVPPGFVITRDPRRGPPEAASAFRPLLVSLRV